MTPFSPHVPRLWHYTWGAAFPAILRSGALLPGRNGNDVEPAVAPLLWLSRNPVVELASRAAAVLGIDSIDDLEHAAWFEPGRRLARIEVAPDRCLPWLDHPEVRAMPDWDVFQLLQLGLESESDPDDWYVTDTPLSMEAWQRVEVWRGVWTTFNRCGGKRIERHKG